MLMISPLFLARFPDKPTNLTATNITSSSADISWVDPENTGDNRGVAVLSGFFITLKKNNSLIRNITTDKVNKRKLINLTPNTTYQITVAAGNQNGFGEETITLFTTLGKGKVKPAIKFIPSTCGGQPCMRIGICGGSKLH